MNESFPSIANERTRRDALDALRAGGVVVLPTDTLYGLSAALSARDAIRRIARLKGSDEEKPYILLAASTEMVDRYVASYGCVDRDRLARAWPAPLTVVLPAAASCPPWVGKTVAIRVPALEPLRALISRLGEPVVSTSVNRTGRPPLSDPVEIGTEFGHAVDGIVAGPPGWRGVASTIVDVTGKAPVVLRKGSHDWDAAG
jgi:L-threonylcarbamoyladenylate synthase